MIHPKVSPVYCTWCDYVPSIALPRAHPCHNNSHEPFLYLQYGWIQVGGIGFLAVLGLFQAQKFSIFGRHASNPFHCGRKNMTAVCCWLVIGDEINTVLWLVCIAFYCSNTEYVTVLWDVFWKNNPRAQTKQWPMWPPVLFSWSASVVSHWSPCFPWL